MDRVRYHPVEAIGSLGDVCGQFYTLKDAGEWASCDPSSILKATKRPCSLSAGGFFWQDWHDSDLDKQPRVCAKCGVTRKAKAFLCSTGRKRSYCNLCEAERARAYRAKRHQ